MNPISGLHSGHTRIRVAAAAIGANVFLAAVAATTALARGGGGSHSFSGGSHSSGGSSHHLSSSGHFIYHNGHYYYTSGGGSHVAGGVVTAIVLGSFALVALIPLTFWLLRRSKSAAERAVHAAESHKLAHREERVEAPDPEAAEPDASLASEAAHQEAAGPNKRQPTGV